PAPRERASRVVTVHLPELPAETLRQHFAQGDRGPRWRILLVHVMCLMNLRIELAQARRSTRYQVLQHRDAQAHVAVVQEGDGFGRYPELPHGVFTETGNPAYQ